MKGAETQPIPRQRHQFVTIQIHRRQQAGIGGQQIAVGVNQRLVRQRVDVPLLIIPLRSRKVAVPLRIRLQIVGAEVGQRVGAPLTRWLGCR